MKKKTRLEGVYTCQRAHSVKYERLRASSELVSHRFFCWSSSCFFLQAFWSILSLFSFHTNTFFSYSSLPREGRQVHDWWLTGTLSSQSQWGGWEGSAGPSRLSAELGCGEQEHFCLILVSSAPSVWWGQKAAAVKAVTQEQSAALGSPHKGCSVVSVWGGHLFFRLKNFRILC